MMKLYVFPFPQKTVVEFFKMRKRRNCFNILKTHTLIKNALPKLDTSSIKNCHKDTKGFGFSKYFSKKD